MATVSDCRARVSPPFVQLDILAGNLTYSGVMSGEVLLNGRLRNPDTFQKLSCYVMQRDVLLESATVRVVCLPVLAHQRSAGLT